ncbi:hypothetical protein IFM89_035912 [Coptis chinensis]|uniref:Uncharacterized protein n=1 Tax=Coptis chinensis TaxID=261450 RepID=A0A835H025_9MAGN|nr:hypothetical protein IFM89_035912 [Coptis chinensis]
MVATAAEKHSEIVKETNPSPILVCLSRKWRSRFTLRGTEEGDVVHPAECMHQLLEKVRRHKVNIDCNVCTGMCFFSLRKENGSSKAVRQILDSYLLAARGIICVAWALWNALRE